MLGSDFADVLAAARRGDEVAFARLWRDLQPALLRYFQALGADCAEDLASEVWLDVARGLDGFGGDQAAFRAWLFTIARRRLVDWWRRSARRPVFPVAEPAVYETGGVDLTTEQAMERISTERAVALVSSLPRAQAEVIMLRTVGGLSVSEVARLLGKSPGAVRVMAHRGLRRLAAQLTSGEIRQDVTR